MRRRAIIRSALAVVLTTVACAHHPPVAMDAEADALARRQAELFAAMTAKDADRVAALFAADGALHVAGMPPVEGRAAIGRFYGNLFRFLSSSTATPGAIHVSSGGDMAYGTGRAVNEFAGPAGTTSYDGKYALVWRKVDGEWRIALYAVSSDQQDAGR